MAARNRKNSDSNVAMQEDKRGVIEKIGANLDVPKALISSDYHLEMFGNFQAIIDGCKGILEYDDEKIKLNLGKTTIRFCGSNLSIKSLTFEEAIIIGTIISIDFS